MATRSAVVLGERDLDLFDLPAVGELRADVAVAGDAGLPRLLDEVTEYSPEQDAVQTAVGTLRDTSPVVVTTRPRCVRLCEGSSRVAAGSGVLRGPAFSVA